MMGFVKWTLGTGCNSVWTAVPPYPFSVILSFVCDEQKIVGQNNLLRKLGLSNFTPLVSEKQGKLLIFFFVTNTLMLLEYKTDFFLFFTFQAHVCFAKCSENPFKLSDESWTRGARLHMQTLLSPVSYKQTNPTFSSDQEMPVSDL